MDETRQTAADRYTALETRRRPYLDRGRRNAALTIPSIMPPEGHTASSELPEPYQSVGSTGNSHLAAKITLALFPANSAFFKLTISSADAAAIGTDKMSVVDAKLAESEQEIMTDIATGTLRAKQNEAMLHLQTVGNVLQFVEDSRNIRIFKLDSYVVRRDYKGTVLEVITKESVGFETFTEDEIQEFGLTKSPTDNNIDIYTWYKLENGKTYKGHQEINGVIVAGSEAQYPKDEFPYIALRFRAVDGEDYGRSLVDEVIGDLISLDGLSQAILEGTLAGSKVVWLVQPGVTKVEDIVRARNGDVKIGNANEVGAMQLNKFNDYRVAYEQANEIKQRLAMAFLMNSAIQRNAERVTAEEVRTMAQELEDGLGGVYSLLSQELQLPLVRILVAQLSKQGRIPKLPKEIVKPLIVTGIEALGRGHDAEKLKLFVGEIAQLPGALERINIGELITRMAAARGINTQNLVRSDEEIQAQQQAAMQQQAMMNVGQQVAPQVINQAIQQQTETPQ